MADKIDSNVTGGFICQESTLGVLPAASSQIWYTLEPNSWADFGGKLSTVARSPINDGRKMYKGAVTGLEASGGFQSDLTLRNLTWLMQGFTFATAREAPKTRPLNSVGVAITSVATTDDSFNAASGLDAFKTNMLVKASGFTNSANNGVHVVTTGNVAAKLIVSTNLTLEASPPAAAKLIAVGYQYPATDLALTLNGTEVLLTSATIAPSVLGVAVGQWVFIGDASASAYRYDNNSPFFARVKAINNTTRVITLDRPTITPVADAGTGKTVRLFFGTSVYDEPLAANIVRRSYTIERTLGSDAVGVQSEYVSGAVPNEVTFNIDTAAKITTDLSFVATNYDTRTGTEGPLKAVADTTLVAALGEDAINTTSHVYSQRVSLYGDATPAMTPLVGYCSNAKITVKNNVKAANAIGVLGAFDVTAGEFSVDGSVEAYFGSVAALESVRNYDTVAYDLILTSSNAGIVIDLPKVGLGNGQLNVSANEAVKLPLDTGAFVSTEGYTFGMTAFEYLPNAAM